MNSSSLSGCSSLLKLIPSVLREHKCLQKTSELETASCNIGTRVSSSGSSSLPLLCSPLHLFSDGHCSSVVMVAVVRVVSSAFMEFENLISGFEVSFLQYYAPVILLASLFSLWQFENWWCIAAVFSVFSDIVSLTLHLIMALFMHPKLQTCKHEP